MSTYEVQIQYIPPGAEILSREGQIAIVDKIHFEDLGNEGGNYIIKVQFDGDDGFYWLDIDDFNPDYLAYMQQCHRDGTRPTVQGFHQSQ